MKHTEDGCEPENGGGHEVQAEMLGDEAAGAGEGGGTEHGGADLEADGVGGEVGAEPLGGAGHETGEDNGKAEAGEREGEGGGLGERIPGEERGSDESGEQAVAYEAI